MGLAAGRATATITFFVRPVYGDCWHDFSPTEVLILIQEQHLASKGDHTILSGLTYLYLKEKMTLLTPFLVNFKMRSLRKKYFQPPSSQQEEAID
jgi:hypothetical protein